MDSDKYVSKDVCELVSKNLDEKFDLVLDGLEDLKELVNPKMEMIVRIDAWIRFVKWIAIAILSTAVSTGIVWKIIKHFLDKK